MARIMPHESTTEEAFRKLQKLVVESVVDFLVGGE